MKTTAVALFALALTACGGGGGGGQTDNPLPSTGDGGTSLLPMSVGSQWVYRTYNPLTNVSLTKTTTVAREETLDGAKAGVKTAVFESTLGDLKSITWVEDRGALAARHKEETWLSGRLSETKVLDPYSIRGPIQMPQAGETWADDHTESTYDGNGTLLKAEANRHSWKVLSIDESLTVPAGTFKTVKVQVTKTSGTKMRTLWLAPGVGKVKEDDNGLVEELSSYSLK